MMDKISKSTHESNEKRTGQQLSSSKIQQILENENLVRKEVSEEQDSLFRAFSDGLYFTPNYYQQIKDLCIRYLSELLTTNTIPAKLGIFRGNSVLWSDYSKNPSSPEFFRINIELFSLAYNVRVVVYTITTDGLLTAKIFNNKFDKTVQFINSNGAHLDVIYTQKSMQNIGFCQNIALNVVENTLNEKHDTQKVEWKDFNHEKYTPPCGSTEKASKGQDESKKIAVIKEEAEDTEGRQKQQHKRTKSDSDLVSAETLKNEDQLQFYNMFVDQKTTEEISSLIQKDLSKLSKLPDLFDARLSIADNSTASDSQSSMGLAPGRSFPNSKRVASSEEDEDLELPPPEIKLEKSKSCIDPKQRTSAHFLNATPPGITPRYSTKTYGGETLVPSADTQQPRHRFSESHTHIPPLDPNYQHDASQPKPRTAGRTLSLSTNSEEFGKMYGNFGNMNQGTEGITQLNRNPSQRASMSEKKKPVILEESQHRYTGRLKFFDEAKNYGFIVMDDDGSDIFVHYDDLHKANINKEFLKASKFGNSIRLSFSCMDYIGKYNKSRKATEVQFLA